MKYYKTYTFTTLLYVVLFGLLSLITIPIIVKQFTVSYLENTFLNMDSKANTLQFVYDKVPDKDTFEGIAQLSINNTLENASYLSIINWTGNYVNYPNITHIGEAISENKATDFNGEINGEKLYTYFFNYFNDLKKKSDQEIINLRPLVNSDLIIVYTLNFKEIVNVVNQLREKTYLIFAILGLFLLLVLLFAIRLISFFSEKRLDKKLINLETNTQNLSKLNESISSYQQRIIEEKEALALKKETNPNPKNTTEEVCKQRILTYVRNELVSILITDIAYVYVENTITYIIRKDGKMATSNDSLDKIFSVLDEKLFFKTNRQFIVCITAIEKITKFENNKLKIQVKPKSEIDIIIGKNKASAFKQWLDL